MRRLASEPIDGAGVAGETLLSLYPGPLHLANILLGLEGDLLGTALSRIPTPGGVEESGWWQTLRRMARQRPYLWRNHREAIEKGYLEQGVSSAISFPTGGGKSTLAELKIATVLLRGERVNLSLQLVDPLLVFRALAAKLANPIAAERDRVALVAFVP